MTIRLSIVVVAYNMARELPRTILSLSLPYQQGVDAGDYEIIVVDNGSTQPFDHDACRAMCDNLSIIELEGASPSPAAAINAGIRRAAGDMICVFIDGARMASPGLLAQALTASRISERAVIATVAHHLGPDVQSRSIAAGYGPKVEDELLAAIEWPRDGYRLFDISSFDGSSKWGCFGKISESNALFMSRVLWNEIGGADERFQLPGGGLVNLDLYTRAVNLPNSVLVIVLGEATFHQVHGGISTNAQVSPWKTYTEDYARIKGEPWTLPNTKPVYLGKIADPAFATVEFSARLAYQATLPRPITARRGVDATALSEPLLSSIQAGCLATRYRNRIMQKSPFDQALYAKLIGRLLPRTIIEIGVKDGGSLLWFADMLGANGIDGKIVGVDIVLPQNFSDSRIELFKGRSADLGAALKQASIAELPHPWLVVDDSSHLYDDTLAVLRFFHGYLISGDYIVVEDGVVRSLADRRYRQFDNGPTRAIETFLAEQPSGYEIDRSICDFYGLNVTWNPNGWIRRL